MTLCDFSVENMLGKRCKQVMLWRSFFTDIMAVLSVVREGERRGREKEVERERTEIHCHCQV